MKKVRAVFAVLFLFGIFMALLYTVRPPGLPVVSENEHHELSRKKPYAPTSGVLPGITWADDIHPIFVRNKCGHCHERGREVLAEGLEPYALGIIDPQNENNPYFSYHELVYSEGPPQIQEGETFRDGQCCWPLHYPEGHQRRIWIGHPERSALMHKLDHDYYDWRKPPRFFEEGLSLLWGPPMPMYHIEEEEHEGSETKLFEIRPFHKRILFHISLWLGGSRSELHRWPPRIPAGDRSILRNWIDNTVQIMEDVTGIEVLVSNKKMEPIQNAVVTFVGNYNSQERNEVGDQISLKTDKEGKALLLFPRHSVITDQWFVSSEKESFRAGYKRVFIEPGRISSIMLN
jgi:hypothetical protein